MVGEGHAPCCRHALRRRQIDPAPPLGPERRQSVPVGLARLLPGPVPRDRRLPRHGRHAMPSTPASTAATEGELARASAYQNLGMNSPDQCMAHDNKRIMVKKYPSTIDVPVIRDTLPGHMEGATSHCQGVRSQCLYRYSPCR